jgi:hypothetical protein
MGLRDGHVVGWGGGVPRLVSLDESGVLLVGHARLFFKHAKRHVDANSTGRLISYIRPELSRAVGLFEIREEVRRGAHIGSQGAGVLVAHPSGDFDAGISGDNSLERLAHLRHGLMGEQDAKMIFSCLGEQAFQDFRRSSLRPRQL